MKHAISMKLHVNERSHCAKFIALNEQWITEHFAIEEVDRLLAADPFKFVGDGGYLFSLEIQDCVVVVCELFREAPDCFQLARMAVDPDSRGNGYGRVLMDAAIVKARESGGKKIFLLSNTRLESAIALYETSGFKVTASGQHPQYARCNIVMERIL